MTAKPELVKPEGTKTVLPPEEAAPDGLTGCQRQIERHMRSLRRLLVLKVRLEMEQMARDVMPEIPGVEEE